MQSDIARFVGTAMTLFFVVCMATQFVVMEARIAKLEYAQKNRQACASGTAVMSADGKSAVMVCQ